MQVWVDLALTCGGDVATPKIHVKSLLGVYLRAKSSFPKFCAGANILRYLDIQNVQKWAKTAKMQLWDDLALTCGGDVATPKIFFNSLLGVHLRAKSSFPEFFVGANILRYLDIQKWPKIG